MKKPTYSIPDLEQYLRQKKEGYANPEMTKKIQEDPFLETVLVGLEKQMAQNTNDNILDLLNKKKQRIKASFVSQALTNNNKNTIPLNNIFGRYFSAIGYDLQYLRIHLLLGFNCSCVFILMIVACWLNVLEESPTLISSLDELTGYKP